MSFFNLWDGSGGEYTGETNATGQMHGKGLFTWPNGDKYAGTFKENAQHGYGVQVSADGMKKYDGEWKNGHPHGKGSMRYKNGKKYVGHYVLGWRCGNGLFTWPDSSTYYGEWKDDKKHGQGVSKYANGGKYEGTWCAMAAHGIGTYYFPNGTKFHGRYDMMVRNGPGKFFPVDEAERGGYFEGIWRSGVLKSGKFHLYGKIRVFVVPKKEWKGWGTKKFEYFGQEIIESWYNQKD